MYVGLGALPLSKITRLSEAKEYADGGASAARNACPGAVAAYLSASQRAATYISQGLEGRLHYVTMVLDDLDRANRMCDAEKATAPAPAPAPKAPWPALKPEVKPAVVPAVPGAKMAGFPWVLVIGGVIVVWWFTKKAR